MAINKNKAIAEAQRYTQKGQLDRAIKEYLSIVQEEPEDVRIWLKIGDLYWKKGTVPQAVSTYSRVAQHYSKDGFFLKAVAVWKQILNIDPAFTDAHLRLGELYVQLQLAPDAIAQFQHVIASYERDGRHRDGLALQKKVVELAPDDVISRIRLAEGHARLNDTESAVAEFKIVLEQLFARERFEEYVQVGERVVYLAGDDVDTLRQLSEVYLLRGDPKRALSRLQAVFRATPTDPLTLELLARTFAELGQTPKAISVYRELARIQEETGNAAARIDAFRRILALDSTDTEALSATGAGRAAATQRPLGRSLMSTQGITSTQGMQRLGAVAQPAETLSPEELIRRHTTDIDLLLKYGLTEHALQSADKGLAIDPNNEAILIKRKDAAAALGRRDDVVNTLLRLATVIENRGAGEQAMKVLADLLQLQPNHAEATQRLQRISSGMAAGLERQAGLTSSPPGPLEPNGPDDYAELDLRGLDFSDRGGLGDVRTPDPEGDDDLNLDNFEFNLGDDEPDEATPRPQTVGAIELGPAIDMGYDDDLPAGELPDGDLDDLLQEPAVIVPAPLTVTPPSELPELGDEYAGLFVGHRGATTPAPDLAMVNDFGAVDPIDLPDDNFDDLLNDDDVDGYSEPDAEQSSEFSDAYPAAGTVDVQLDSEMATPIPEAYVGVSAAVEARLDRDALATPAPPPMAPVVLDELAEAPAEVSVDLDFGEGSLREVATADPMAVPEVDFDFAFDAESAESAESAELATPRPAEPAHDEAAVPGGLSAEDSNEDSERTVFASVELDPATELATPVPVAVSAFISEVAEARAADFELPELPELPSEVPEVASTAAFEFELPELPELPSEVPEVASTAAFEFELPELPELPHESGEIAPTTGWSDKISESSAKDEEADAEVDIDIDIPSSHGIGLDFQNSDAGAVLDEDDIEIIEEVELLDDDGFFLGGGEQPEEPQPVLLRASAAPAQLPAGGSSPTRRPMVDARTQVSSVDTYDIEGELADVDFLLDSGLLDDARDAINDLEQRHGVHPALGLRLGRIEDLQRRAVEDAEAALAGISATESAPGVSLGGTHIEAVTDDDVATHFDLGVAYMEMGQYKKAILQLEKVLNSRERGVEAQRVIALCELQQGNAPAAIVRLKDALRAQGIPRDARVALHFDLATALESIGDRIAARVALEAIVREGAGDYLNVRERLAHLSGT